MVCTARDGHFTHALGKNWRQRPDFFCLVSRAAWLGKVCRLRGMRFQDVSSHLHYFASCILLNMYGVLRLNTVFCRPMSSLYNI